LNGNSSWESAESSLQNKRKSLAATNQYLRFPAGVDSTRFIAADGFAVLDCFGKEAERATSLTVSLSTGVDKVIGGHDYKLYWVSKHIWVTVNGLAYC